jgi:hypothetical protein
MALAPKNRNEDYTVMDIDGIIIKNHQYQKNTRLRKIGYGIECVIDKFYVNKQNGSILCKAVQTVPTTGIINIPASYLVEYHILGEHKQGHNALIQGMNGGSLQSYNTVMENIRQQLDIN